MTGRSSERLTSSLTVERDLRKRWSAQRWAATYSHGGSQGFKSPHLHPTLMTSGDAGHRHVRGRLDRPHNGWRTPDCADILRRRSANTAATRYKVLRILYRWLEEEEDIEANPMARMKPPTVSARAGADGDWTLTPRRPMGADQRTLPRPAIANSRSTRPSRTP